MATRKPLHAGEIIDLMDRIGYDDHMFRIHGASGHIQKMHRLQGSGSIYDALVLTNGNWSFRVEFWNTGWFVICWGADPFESFNRQTYENSKRMILEIRRKINQLERLHGTDIHVGRVE